MNALDDPLYRELVSQRLPRGDSTDGPTARWMVVQRQALIDAAERLRLIRGAA